jgi:ABC-type glycerol-3-phosphate transport system substrate-binding protein
MSDSDSVYMVNTELLDRLGLKMPRHDWTWEEFEALAGLVCKDGHNYMMKNRKESFWLFCM